MSLLSIVFLLITGTLFSAVNNNIAGIPGPVPGLPIGLAFHNLRNTANTQAVTDFLIAIEDFEDSLFDPLVNIDNIQDQTPLINRFVLVKDKLSGCDGHIRPFLRTLKSMLTKRVDLALLDQHIYEHHGRTRTFNHPSFTPDVQNSLRTLTGMIFHITKSLSDAGNIEESVRGIGSATLVNLVDVGGIPTITNLAAVPPPGIGHQQLNGILTCAHVLTADKDEQIEAYFVPSDMLNLTFGLPEALNTVTLPGATRVNLINFLRTNPSSFRITRYTTWQRRPPAPIRTFPNNGMDVAHPMYLENEDIVVASIAPNAGAALRNYAAPAAANFIVNAVAMAAFIAAPHQEYFAIGYPGCKQYDLDLLNNFSQDLVRSSIAPLFITRGQLPLVANNGQITYRAPVAGGMSGGPTLTVDGNTINVFGVISKSDGANEIACYIG